MRNIMALATDIHRRNRKWWYTEDGVLLARDPGELFMLAISEVAEAMEGLRKSKPSAPLMDDKLPHRVMEEVEIADTVIRLLDAAVGLKISINLSAIEARSPLFRATLAGSLIEISKAITKLDEAVMDGTKQASWFLSLAVSLSYDYCAARGFDLDGAIDEKLAYNDNRKDHTYEARKAAGGKSF